MSSCIVNYSMDMYYVTIMDWTSLFYILYKNQFSENIYLKVYIFIRMDNDQRQGDKNMITIINLQKVLTLNILMSVLMNYLLNLIS